MAQTKKRTANRGSGRIPKADSPLDPGPGLGDKPSMGLFLTKASDFWDGFNPGVTAVTGRSRSAPLGLT